ncbi:hypothetical protein DAPPUDRAFT_219999 [Daphnia pulex]|uniref:GRIP domain-containing protein n=1 Tax=Daphnia pulex TaxID=6669 RepID=E9FRY7_DAPPU|nr:hypothetical protein DAPPUDRAFT_219999 [Daphnia pulex]|eukprot:EFX90403.1 hypothetical protein DAPPUDRAFT_219999 [Daphnia pulex]
MEESFEKTNNVNKKLPLEELDRDELLKRCKSYLALAQRAKQARDEVQQRETSLLDKISTLESQIIQLGIQEKTCSNNEEEHLESIEDLSLTSNVSDLVLQLKLKDEETNLLLSKSEAMQAQLKTLEENYEQQKDGFVEELNKMNDVLKQRGEAITRLEYKCQTNEKEFKAKTETFLQLVAERERKIEQLESESSRFETQSEVMSTSTVSKVEEIHRMKDVEDSLEDRYNKLKMLAVKMKRKIAEQNTQLQEKDNQLTLLKAEDKKTHIRNNSLNLQMNLDAVQLELDSIQNELQQQRTEIRHVTAKAESKENEVDNLKLQLSTVNAELHKLQTGSSLLIETLRKHVAALEEATAAEKMAKDSLQSELSELRAEYENYKIRATSVLKKQKTEAQPSATSSKEAADDFNTDQVEREMLQRVVEALKGKIAELESQLAHSQSEVSNFRVERERTAATQSSIVEAMQNRLERAESEMEVIKREHQAQISRLQGDNQLLASLHREQIDGIKLRHAQEILELQNNLDEVGLESARLQKIISSYQAQRTVSPLTKAGDLRRDEAFMIERERGEGSEDGSVTRRSTQREDSDNDARKPIPLELLLNSQLASEETVVFQTERPETISFEQYSESLALVEKRCNHLSALLAESEANEARLSQLADALKEEIRRSERSEERQKHIENLEYLKNVVLKFVTLPRGEERSRLVPVLTTLLRLSPVEVQEYQCAMKTELETNHALLSLLSSKMALKADIVHGVSVKLSMCMSKSSAG